MRNLPYAILLSLFTSTCFAQVSSSPRNEFNRFQQQSKEQLAQVTQQQQLRWIEQHRFQPKPMANEATPASVNCLPYQGIKFVNFTLIDPTPFAPRPQECLNESRLNQLSQQLTQAYLDKGYIYNPFRFEDDQSGWLILRVVEGKVAHLRTDSQRLNLSMLFPHFIGQPLNVHQLDQGLDQANKMAGSQVSVDVLPNTTGEIELFFVNQEKNQITGSLGVDNYSAKTYGRWQLRSGVNIDSPFGLSDTLYLSLNHSLKSAQHNLTRSGTLFYSVPYGRWTSHFFASLSEFRSDINLRYNQLEQRGKTWQAGVRVDYLLQRGSNYISHFSTQLERINSRSRLADIQLESQSPSLSNVQLTLNHLQLFDNASLITDLSYKKGFSHWSALSAQNENYPKGQFDKWNLSVQFNRYQTIGKQLLHYSNHLTLQYSSDYLPAIEQAELLGKYTVRGFNDLSLSAEKNIVFRHNLGWVNTLGKWKIEPYVALDFGIQKMNGASHSQRAFGYATGINLAHSRLSTNIEWATGRLFLNQHQIQQERSLFANLTWQF